MAATRAGVGVGPRLEQLHAREHAPFVHHTARLRPNERPVRRCARAGARGTRALAGAVQAVRRPLRMGRQHSGVRCRDKGTDNRDKGTGNLRTGTDNRDKGRDNLRTGTDNRDTGAEKAAAPPFAACARRAPLPRGRRARAVAGAPCWPAPRTGPARPNGCTPRSTLGTHPGVRRGTLSTHSGCSSRCGFPCALLFELRAWERGRYTRALALRAALAVNGCRQLPGRCRTRKGVL